MKTEIISGICFRSKSVGGELAKQYVYHEIVNDIDVVIIHKYLLAKRIINGMTAVKKYKDKILYYSNFAMKLSTFNDINTWIKLSITLPKEIQPYDQDKADEFTDENGF